MAITVFDSISAFLKDDDWGFEVLKPGVLIKFGFTAPSSQKYEAYAQVFEDRSQLAVYTMMPIKAAPEVRATAMEFLTRANYGMILGNFEMDLNDGEIRYKTSIDVEGSALDAALSRHLIYSNCLTADRYLNGLLAVYGGRSAIEAIAIVEGPKAES